jgi:AcrR family transcriptional regulator
MKTKALNAKTPVRKKVAPAKSPPAKGVHRGRQRCHIAEAAILKAASELLTKNSLRDITAEAIAVSKATIYKWWPNKNRVALDAFLSQMEEQVPTPNTGSVLRDFSEQLVESTRFYTSRYGRMLAQFLAEGQSDPDFLALFRERFQQPRRKAVRIMWDRAVDRGEIRKEVDVELVIDLLFGAVVYRLMGNHNPLDDATAKAMVETIFHGVLMPKTKSKARN